MTKAATEQPVMFEVSDKTKTFILSRLSKKTIEKNVPSTDIDGVVMGFADIIAGIYLKEEVIVINDKESAITAIYATPDIMSDLLCERIKALENC